MKKIILLLICCVTNAQLYTYDELSKVTRLKEIPNKISEYQASNGDIFKVGDKIEWGTPTNENNIYAFINEWSSLGASYTVSLKQKGWKGEIIKFRKWGDRRAGFELIAICKTSSGVTRAYVEIERALNSGEIVTSKLNRSQAISKLKEAKDLYDLEIMSKEEYEKIRAELTPIITGKK